VIHIHTYVHMYVCIHTYVCAYIHMCAYIRTHTHIQIHTHTHTHMYAYIRAHTHRHTHTHTHTLYNRALDFALTINDRYALDGTCVYMCVYAYVCVSPLEGEKKKQGRREGGKSQCPSTTHIKKLSCVEYF
jgi:hypothetical protein